MHVMLDLETMGRTTTAPIVAIGAVTFTSVGVHDSFYTAIQLQSAAEGAVIDPETVLWWLEQSDDVRAEVRRATEPQYRALERFANWLPQEFAGIWGNGAGFDNALLAAAYTRMKLPVPWRFWQDRCYRTVKSLFPGVPYTRTGTHHHALDDARTQAEHLIAINAAHGRFL